MSLLSIAICGLGSAGRSRLKAINALDTTTCAGIISRRADIANFDFKTALANPNIDAIAISTENTDHAERVKACLNADKHVLCDYPLAFNRASCQELFDLARRKNRVLHVEHIGLLTTAHLKAKQDLAKMGCLKEGSYTFKGSWKPELEDKSKQGPLPFLSVSRLLQLADWFGNFKVTGASLEFGDKSYQLKLKLQFKTGGSLDYVDHRQEGLPRTREMTVETTDGPYTWPQLTEKPGLFAQDLAYFAKRIAQQDYCYYNESLMIDVIDQLAKLPLANHRRAATSGSTG